MNINMYMYLVEPYIFTIYTLHILHGQSLGIRCLILLLKIFIDKEFLILFELAVIFLVLQSIWLQRQSKHFEYHVSQRLDLLAGYTWNSLIVKFPSECWR